MTPQPDTPTFPPTVAEWDAVLSENATLSVRAAQAEAALLSIQTVVANIGEALSAGDKPAERRHRDRVSSARWLAEQEDKA